MSAARRTPSKSPKAGGRAKERASAASRAPSDPKAALAALAKLGSQRTLDGYSRYGIVDTKAFGIPVGVLHGEAKRHGKSHELALALWKSGWYEARLLACFVDEPGRVTRAQMDTWAKAFDNWAICDTACMHLFDRTPFAFAKVDAWAQRRAEFVVRASFALLASLALHAKALDDAPFLERLPLIEAGAGDERNFVKKAVSWALRSIGRRSSTLHAEALALAQRLATSKVACERWVGKDVLRDLQRPAIAQRLAARAAKR